VIAHPFDADGDKADLWEVLDLFSLGDGLTSSVGAIGVRP
jgi:hypothetical protein